MRRVSGWRAGLTRRRCTQTEHISRGAPALLEDAALRALLLAAVLLDTGNLVGVSVRLRPLAAPSLHG